MLLIGLAPTTVGAFLLSNLTIYNTVVANFKLTRVHHLNVRKAMMMFVDRHVVRMQLAQTRHTPASCKFSFNVWLTVFTRLMMMTAQRIVLCAQEQTTRDVYGTEYRCTQFMAMQNR
jgi:hypothetical protein